MVAIATPRYQRLPAPFSHLLGRQQHHPPTPEARQSGAQKTAEGEWGLWEGWQLRVLQMESQELKAVLKALVALASVRWAEAPQAAAQLAPNGLPIAGCCAKMALGKAGALRGASPNGISRPETAP
eukprot:SAG31_NODE_3860_length_3814_cov_2.455720_1_plen_126_part_00